MSYIGKKNGNPNTDFLEAGGELENHDLVNVDSNGKVTSFTSTGIDDNATSTAMTLDSSGNLLVGTTSYNMSDATSGSGIALQSDGQLEIANSGVCARFNSHTSNGTIAEFRKSGTTFGSIGVQSDDRLTIGCNDIGIGFVQDADAIVPWNDSTKAYVDNKIDLGTSSQGFKDLYLSGGVYVGGTGSANYLDDYEEGTWTPTIADSSSGGNTATIGTTEGRYTKIGNLVTISMTAVNINTSGMTATNELVITGLPYTSASGNSYGIGTVMGDRFNFDGYMVSWVGISSSYIILRNIRDSDTDVGIDVQHILSTGSDLIINVQYYTNS